MTLEEMDAIWNEAKSWREKLTRKEVDKGKG